jgi:hypothetical protein
MIFRTLALVAISAIVSTGTEPSSAASEAPRIAVGQYKFEDSEKSMTMYVMDDGKVVLDVSESHVVDRFGPTEYTVDEDTVTLPTVPKQCHFLDDKRCTWARGPLTFSYASEAPELRFDDASGNGLTLVGDVASSYEPIPVFEVALRVHSGHHTQYYFKKSSGEIYLENKARTSSALSKEKSSKKVEDVCHQICHKIPGVCGKNASYCKRDHDCHDLFWKSPEETMDSTDPFCQYKDCTATKRKLLCAEAALWMERHAE